MPSRDEVERTWRLEAACLAEDPELFFPDGEPGSGLAQLEIARRVCGTCSVREPCLASAFATNARYGMWGGPTPDERRRLGPGHAARPSSGSRFVLAAHSDATRSDRVGVTA